jgi:hypothetical protein
MRLRGNVQSCCFKDGLNASPATNRVGRGVWGLGFRSPAATSRVGWEEREKERHERWRHGFRVSGSRKRERERGMRDGDIEMMQSTKQTQGERGRDKGGGRGGVGWGGGSREHLLALEVLAIEACRRSREPAAIAAHDLVHDEHAGVGRVLVDNVFEEDHALTCAR